MNVLMVDIGGTNVKVMASHNGEMRRMPSGQVLTASEMVRGVLALTADLEFDRVSLGLPCLVEHGKPALEPSNLGNGWVGFDYSQAFGKPVRCINDAAMQALGTFKALSHVAGRPPPPRIPAGFRKTQHPRPNPIARSKLTRQCGLSVMPTSMRTRVPFPPR
jgi:predicted NBD/HSP70 family sugar kinase